MGAIRSSNFLLRKRFCCVEECTKHSTGKTRYLLIAFFFVIPQLEVFAVTYLYPSNYNRHRFFFRFPPDVIVVKLISQCISNYYIQEHIPNRKKSAVSTFLSYKRRFLLATNFELKIRAATVLKFLRSLKMLTTLQNYARKFKVT